VKRVCDRLSGVAWIRLLRQRFWPIIKHHLIINVHRSNWSIDRQLEIDHRHLHTPNPPAANDVSIPRWDLQREIPGLHLYECCPLRYIMQTIYPLLHALSRLCPTILFRIWYGKRSQADIIVRKYSLIFFMKYNTASQLLLNCVFGSSDTINSWSVWFGNYIFTCPT
jgi:hypothetical protein